MMNLKVIAGLFFIVTILNSSVLKAGPHDNQNQNTGDASRVESDEKKVPKQYGDLDSVLKTTSDETKVEVTGYDSTADKEKKIKWSITDKRINNTISSRKDLLEALDKVKAYREKLNTGKWCDTDKSAKDFSGVLDSYIQYLSDAFVAGKGKTTVLSEKKINTFTMGLRHFMEDKATFFEAKKDKFVKSDEDLKLALNAIASILWQGKFREESFNKDFPWEKLKVDAETKDVVETVITARKDLEAMSKADATKSGDKLCKLDSDPTAPPGSGSTAGSTAGATAGTTAGSTAGTTAGTTAGKTAGSTAGATAGTSAGATAGATAGTTAGNAAPSQDPTATGTTAGVNSGTTADTTVPFNPSQGATGATQSPATTNVGQDPLQAQAIRDLLDSVSRQRLDDEQNRLQDQDLLAQALGQLGQIQPPSNRSASREESNQGPQISPSIDASKAQTPPFQPPQFPVPAPQALGGLPPGLFQTPQVPLIPMPESKKWDNDSPKPAPLPVEDPRTTALMDMLKVQQQMLQGAIQQGSLGNPNIYGNGMNINRLGGGMPGRFGRGRSTMSLGGRSLPGRSGGKVFRGTAKGGSLGRLSVSPNSRGRLPSGIK